MAGAKVGSSKNKENQRHRFLNGKKVNPVMYNGRAVGHGKYLAGEVEGKLVLDSTGKPEQYMNIGSLV